MSGENPKTFKCSNCGCEFEAFEGEYKLNSELANLYILGCPNLMKYVCECPACGRAVYNR